MADVVICYAPDNQATVRQLADAIRAEGWTVWYDESPAAGSAGGVTEQILNAKAAVVVWSASAVASEWVRADANVARGLRRLVQASADDATPPVPFEAGEVASISTWLGDTAHPGWARIRAELVALAGAPAGTRRR